MNPSYGQSASFAFEDAATLALLLKDGSYGEVAKALKEYSNQRIGRCMEIQRRSEERATVAEPAEEHLLEGVRVRIDEQGGEPGRNL